MKLIRSIRVFGFVLFFALGHPLTVLAADEDKDHADKPAEGPRTKAAETTLPDEYQKLRDGLGKIGASIPMAAKPVPGMELPENKNKEFQFTDKMVEKLRGKDETINGKVNHTPGILDVISDYRKKLGPCFDTDPGSKQVSEVIDAYIKHIQETFGADPKDTKKVIDEKMVNTYTEEIIRFLDEKAKAFEKSKATFEKSDKAFVTSLKQLAGVLWGSEAGEFKREDEFKKKFDASKDDATKTIVEANTKNIEAMKGRAKLDQKTCTLDEATAPVDDKDKKKEDNKDEKPGPGTKPAPGEGKNDTGGGAGGGTGAGTGAGAGAGGAAGAGADADGTPIAVQPNPQNQAELDNLGNLLAQLQAQKDALDLQKELLDQDNLRNDDALKSLNDALANSQRPNNSKSNEKSEQGPQISPSVDASKSGGQPQPQPQPSPQQPPPQQGGIPPYLLQPQPPQNLPLEMFKSYKAESDLPKAKAAVPDANNTGLLDLLRIQQQMMQNMLAQRGGQNNGGMQNVGNRLSSFGGIRILTHRFGQGLLSINGVIANRASR